MPVSNAQRQKSWRDRHRAEWFRLKPCSHCGASGAGVLMIRDTDKGLSLCGPCIDAFTRSIAQLRAARASLQHASSQS
jgi:hypothetical protein